MKMTRLRPSVSARWPVMGDATRAKREVAEVMRDLSRVVRFREERSLRIETSIDEITPVLYDGVSLLYRVVLRRTLVMEGK